MLRKVMSEGADIPEHFSRPEVVAVLREYYASLEEKTEIKLHRYSRGDR
jgi:sulfate adenylyltransferase